MGYDFISNNRKTKWTKNEILSFLRDDVGNTFFSPQGKAKYDGLLVCVSGHGIRGHVVTSNLEHVDKTRISRCIYDRFPKFIDIPRIFIFDACAGARERRHSFAVETPLDIGITETEGGDTGKGNTNNTALPPPITVGHNESGHVSKHGDNDRDSITVSNTAATTESSTVSVPKMDFDRGSALIHAANTGYQAKMRGDIGSYLLYSFMERVQRNVILHERKGLEELMGEIQNGLHGMGRQQTVNVFNENSKNIRLEMKSKMKKIF